MPENQIITDIISKSVNELYVTMKNKKLIIIALVAMLVLFSLSFFRADADVSQLETQVKRGEFEIIITSTGELQAENSEKILGPAGLRSIRIWQVKITDLIPEGSMVDSGDYVATLDRSEATGKLKDIESELETAESQLTKTQLDTTLELRALRDNMINLKYAVEEAKIRLEQSKYEPPATIRQTEIEKSKAERTYTQALENYKLKVKQAQARVQEMMINLEKQRRKQENILKVLANFVVKAPKPGMLIYERDWNGTKRKVGSMVSTWEPTVATLPDLSSMVSKTYINEIDISKIKKGQQVSVGVDAFPNKAYSGEIIEVANIGEQLPNSDAKVFKVLIKISESDSILRPAMTTSNGILTAHFDDVLYLPLEAIHQNDTLSYVYKSGVKQEVITGQSNDNQIVIEKGLSENDVIYLSEPPDGDAWELQKISSSEL